MRSVPRFLSFLFLPFAWLYGGIVRLRNWLYDRHLFSSYAAPIPVLCVGNLAVGGTGKTPQVEYLARLLPSHKVAILSRGYKRQSKGFVLADAQATAATIGDEPYQYVQNLAAVTVAVCEKREIGIKKLLQAFPGLKIILLDDAFQHRAVTASAYLLLTDYNHLFTQDFLLPVGRLREPRSGARRADAVVVTKCPDVLSPEKRDEIQWKIKAYTSPQTPVFFSQIVYAPAVPLGGRSALGKKLVLVTGIANAQPLVRHLQTEGFQLLHHFEEADHAAYTVERVREIVAFWHQIKEPEVAVLLTQKDAVKWQTPELMEIWRLVPVFYLPITVAFGPQEPTFDDIVRQWVSEAGSGINSYI